MLADIQVQIFRATDLFSRRHPILLLQMKEAINLFSISLSCVKNCVYSQNGHGVFKWRGASHPHPHPTKQCTYSSNVFMIQSSPLCKLERGKSKCQTLLHLIWNCVALKWCISCCTFQLKYCTVLRSTKVASDQLILSSVSSCFIISFDCNIHSIVIVIHKKVSLYYELQTKEKNSESWFPT